MENIFYDISLTVNILFLTFLYQSVLFFIFRESIVRIYYTL